MIIWMLFWFFILYLVGEHYFNNKETEKAYHTLKTIIEQDEKQKDEKVKDGEKQGKLEKDLDFEEIEDIIKEYS